MTIYIATDHNGIEVKNKLVNYLKENELDVRQIDIQNDPKDDYPDFAFSVCENVIKSKGLGILICGNGIGMSIAANKVKGIRAARVSSVDDACKAKNHNGANVITFGANLDFNLIKEIVDSFITTKEPSEPRHLKRVEKIQKYEDGE